MRKLGHRVQLALLLGAVAAPCVVLIALSIRMARQDRELRASHRVDARKQVLARAAERMRAQLENIRSDEIRVVLEPGQSYRHPETVFVAWMENGRLVLPWEPERDRAVRQSLEQISERFESAVRACEAREAAKAAACLEALEATARNPFQRAYVQWKRADALDRAGQASRAVTPAMGAIEAGPKPTDRGGIPLSLHAASMLGKEITSERVLRALEAVLSSRPWAPPEVLLIVSEVARRAGEVSGDAAFQAAAREIERKSAVLSEVVDQAQLLEADLRARGPLIHDVWVPFGQGELWLVGRAGGEDVESAIFVVRGDPIFRRASIPGAVRLADSRDTAGDFIGSSFPGLRVVFDPAESQVPERNRGIDRSLFSLALALTVAATIFAAYLLWRDLQREVRVSELRAQFVSSVSHELKTPLTAIRMFAETLQMGRCNDEATRAEYLGTIVSECERLTRLVDGVLLFSKTEQGKKIYRFRPIQLAEAVADAARAMEYPLAQHGFRLHTEIREDLPPFSADRDAIEQAVLNLLSNAMKFSGDQRDIELALGGEGDEAVIRVSDHGVGIAAEDQPRIFEKFYRAATPENQLIPGAGLGLALVAQIAQAHGGRVVVKSEPGKGSTFELRLPAAARG